MDQKRIITGITKEVKRRMAGEGTGHDWYHVERVVKTSRHIARKEGADAFIVELAALLHEVGDWKLHGGDDSAAGRIVREMLDEYRLPAETISAVIEIIETMSWRGGKNPPLRTLEGQIVQDADRLESLGALGIARCFAYGGKKGRPIYDPGIQLKKKFKTKEEYFNYPGTSINHFYEKLLLLKDRINTKTGKRLALPRHRYLEQFLKRFHEEWKGL